jgi:hypothetical protein
MWRSNSVRSPEAQGGWNQYRVWRQGAGEVWRVALLGGEHDKMTAAINYGSCRTFWILRMTCLIMHMRAACRTHPIRYRELWEAPHCTGSRRRPCCGSLSEASLLSVGACACLTIASCLSSRKHCGQTFVVSTCCRQGARWRHGDVGDLGLVETLLHVGVSQHMSVQMSSHLPPR